MPSVPRVTDVTGRPSADLARLDREHGALRKQVKSHPKYVQKASGMARAGMRRKKIKVSLNRTVLHEQRRPKRWHDYNPGSAP